MVKRLRHRPFTAVTRVRFPLESFLGYRIYADVAQLAEQLICNQQVIGSSPIIGSVVIFKENRYEVKIYFYKSLLVISEVIRTFSSVG